MNLSSRPSEVLDSEYKPVIKINVHPGVNPWYAEAHNEITGAAILLTGDSNELSFFMNILDRLNIEYTVDLK